jgi:predicted small lipoprotein YifL
MRPALALLLVLALAGCGQKREARTPNATAAAPDTTPPANPADAVRKYYAYLEAKDYPRAYAMWGLDGLASKQTYAEFVDGFGHTAQLVRDRDRSRVDRRRGGLELRGGEGARRRDHD